MSRLVSVLRRRLEPLGAGLPPVHLVGGAVRDHLLERETKDIGLMCAGPQALARALASIHDAGAGNGSNPRGDPGGPGRRGRSKPG